VEKVLIYQGLSEINCHRRQRERKPASSQRGIFPTVKGWEELSERNVFFRRSSGKSISNYRAKQNGGQQHDNTDKSKTILTKPQGRGH
jgi:hypothetical protein